MARGCLNVFLLVFLVTSVSDLVAEEASPSLWAVDPLVKVFPDTAASELAKKVEFRGGANEYLSGQVAVRAKRELEGLSASWEPLRHRESNYVIPASSLRWRFVGFVPVKRNTPNTAASNLLRAAPCEIPDPLLEVERMDLSANRTQPIWLTVFVPPDAPPGAYDGRFSIGNAEASRAIEVLLEVYPFTLPEERHLWVTNWFNAGRIAQFHRVSS